MSRRLLTLRGDRVLTALWEDGRIIECSADIRQPAFLNRIYVARVEHIVHNIGGAFLSAGNQKLYEKLCNEVLERPDMITDPRFVDMPGRLANQDAIAEVIEERIKDLTPNEAAELVLAHGIPAGPIMNIKEILDDPHVKEREMFVEMDHPTLGKVTVNGCAIKLMDTKPSVRTPAPQLGQNNRDIFEGVLGMTEEQFNTLYEKQVF